MKRSFWRKALLGIAGVLFLASLWGGWKGLSVSSLREQVVTRVTYDLEGKFDHRAYGRPVVETDTPNPRYFTKIVESIEMSYSYKFLPQQAVSGVSSEVEITAVVESKDNWKTETVLVPSTRQEGEEFTIAFPLDPAVFQEIASQISAEIGVPAGTPDVTIMATVHTTVDTGQGLLEEELQQTVRLKASSGTIEWERGLSLSRKGYYKGLSYEQKGDFGYAVHLKPNILFGPVTMTPEVLALEPPAPLPSAPSYSAQNLQRIDTTFAFKLTSEPPLKQVAEKVEVTGILTTPAGSQTFDLVPEKEESGDFSVTFPLEMELFYPIIRAAEQEMEVSPSAQTLTIRVKVQTTAESDFGPVEEELRHTIALKLTPGAVEWPESEPETVLGSIRETVISPNPSASTAKTGSLAAMVMMGTIFGFVLWNYVQAGRDRPTALELEAMNARQKHGELLVDVESVPELVGNGANIQLGSLEELFKVAEALFKPVLHRSGPDKHVYFVFDGNTLYHYLNQQVPGVEEVVKPSEPLTKDDGVAEAIGPDSAGGRPPSGKRLIWDRLRRRSPRQQEPGVEEAVKPSESSTKDDDVAETIELDSAGGRPPFEKRLIWDRLRRRSPRQQEPMDKDS